MERTLFFLFLIAVLNFNEVHVSCQIPIPSRPLGYVYPGGLSSAPIHLEVYVDLTCPDCQQAWPTVKQLVQFYGPEKIRLLVQLFPLPYHTNAFIAAQSVPVVATYNASLVFPWIDVLFKFQNELYNIATMDKNRYDVINIVASLAPKAGISNSVMKAGLLNVDKERTAAIIAWKHGCQRTVAATPSFFINGIFVDQASASWTLQQWKNLIDPLLNGKR